MNGDSATSIFRTNYDLPVIHNATKDIFLNDVYPKRKPVILRGIDIGPCREKWSVDHLRQFGGVKEIITIFNFCTKGSRRKTFEFFLSEEEHYYLRALGDDPRKDIADIHHQFPELAADIHLPEFYEPSKFYSSVFRIASPGVQLWTHYDVMDNLLIQVNGRKRVVLFSPREVENLYLNGDKSEVIDIDNPDLERFPKFPDAERHEGFLDPGDILFIPALWFHNVISLEFGVAVNVFWKHLSPNLYDHKDTYGNKDPQPAARATQILDRALKTLEELPPEYRDFYARRLVTRIQTKTYMKQDDSVS